MKNKQNGSGIRLYFLIPIITVRPFLAGKEVQAWPTNPIAVGGPDKKVVFPCGTTLIRIDTDQVEVKDGEHGVFTIQRKGVVKRRTKKGAGKPLLWGDPFQKISLRPSHPCPADSLGVSETDRHHAR